MLVEAVLNLQQVSAAAHNYGRQRQSYYKKVRSGKWDNHKQTKKPTVTVTMQAAIGDCNCQPDMLLPTYRMCTSSSDRTTASEVARSAIEIGRAHGYQI